MPFIFVLFNEGLPQDKWPARVVVSETAMATCYEENSSRVAGSMLVRRPTLLSPDGHNKAYAENAAVAHGPLGQCANTAKLFVRRPGEKDFRLAYHQDPSEYELLNDIRIVDWSPNSRYLLAQLEISQWGSDWGTSVPVLYDAQTGTVTPEDWLDSVLEIHFDNHCSLDPFVERLGFTPSGGVIIRIRPARDMVEGGLEPDSCIKTEQLFLLHPATHVIAPLAGKHKIQKYGHFVKQAKSTND